MLISVGVLFFTRVVASMVLNIVNVISSKDVELVLGGEVPRLVLSDVHDCLITLHKEKWRNDVECTASRGVSISAVERGESDTLSLQEAIAVERVLLPDSLQTMIQAGRMTTQCHFRHLQIADRQQSQVPEQKVTMQRSQAALAGAPLSSEVSSGGGHNTSGRFGVGLLLKRLEDGSLQVAKVAEGGPADKDGRIEAGDQLTAINGIPTLGKRLRDIGEELLGTAGSEVWVSLQQMRNGAAKVEKHIVLQRGPISRSTDSLQVGDVLVNEIQQSAPLSSLTDYQPSRAIYNGGTSSPPLLPPPATRQSLSESGMRESSATNIQSTRLSAHDLDERLKDTRSRIEQALSSITANNAHLHSSSSGVGVGLVVKPASDGAYRVSGLVSNGAAEASGQIAVGDVLHSVDGINVCFKSHETVKNLVQGPLGSRVVLSFLRTEAQPEDLKKSVNEFDHWRPVVLERTSNPSGYKTPVLDISQDYGGEDSLLSPLARRPISTVSRSAPPPLPDDKEMHHKKEETIGLTLYLDEDYGAIAGSEPNREAFCSDLAFDLSTSLRTHHSRIKVVDLLPGSVLADVHVHPPVTSTDPRSPERLSAEIAIMVVDPQVPLYVSAF
jgi:C-terminal processing protease CtpA/Prc